MFYGKIERTLGADSMGTSFVGIFQDEHPPTPRDIYTDDVGRIISSSASAMTSAAPFPPSTSMSGR